MQETQVQPLAWEDPLEKEMAAHSSILAWRIPGTEEPSGLPSMGLQRVEHNWATNTRPWLCCPQTVWAGIRSSASLLLVFLICNFGPRLTYPGCPEGEMAGWVWRHFDNQGMIVNMVIDPYYCYHLCYHGDHVINKRLSGAARNLSLKALCFDVIHHNGIQCGR